MNPQSNSNGCGGKVDTKSESMLYIPLSPPIATADTDIYGKSPNASVTTPYMVVTKPQLPPSILQL